MLKAEKQLSVSWMGIPSFSKVHIPGCDFSAMISHDFLVLQREIKMMTHHISTCTINHRWLTKISDFAGIWRHLHLRRKCRC
jgi:hypothetical protein